MALNGLKCVLNTTYFFKKKFESVENDPVQTPPLSVEFSTLFYLRGSQSEFNYVQSTNHDLVVILMTDWCRPGGEGAGAA